MHKLRPYHSPWPRRRTKGGGCGSGTVQEEAPSAAKPQSTQDDDTSSSRVRGKQQGAAGLFKDVYLRDVPSAHQDHSSSCSRGRVEEIKGGGSISSGIVVKAGDWNRGGGKATAVGKLKQQEAGKEPESRAPGVAEPGTERNGQKTRPVLGGLYEEMIWKPLLRAGRCVVSSPGRASQSIGM